MIRRMLLTLSVLLVLLTLWGCGGTSRSTLASDPAITIPAQSSQDVTPTAEETTKTYRFGAGDRMGRTNHTIHRDEVGANAGG